MTMPQQIDTAHVSNRRTLHFNSLDDVLADVTQLVEAERAGKLERLGNWPLGRSLGHLASWINYSFDGVPMKVPWIIRLLLRTTKKSTLYKPMPAGRNIPRVPGGTLGTEPLSTEDGFGRMTTALARMKAGPPALPHLLFGPLTHNEWINQHLRHAELHLSFFRMAGV